MNRAKVKWFNDIRGFGFLEYDDTDVFVHYSEIQGYGFKTLKEDEAVEFDLYITDKGPLAKNVRKV